MFVCKNYHTLGLEDMFLHLTPLKHLAHYTTWLTYEENCYVSFRTYYLKNCEICFLYILVTMFKNYTYYREWNNIIKVNIPWMKSQLFRKVKISRMYIILPAWLYYVVLMIFHHHHFIFVIKNGFLLFQTE